MLNEGPAFLRAHSRGNSEIASCSPFSSCLVWLISKAPRPAIEGLKYNRWQHICTTWNLLCLWRLQWLREEAHQQQLRLLHSARREDWITMVRNSVSFLQTSFVTWEWIISICWWKWLLRAWDWTATRALGHCHFFTRRARTHLPPENWFLKNDSFCVRGNDAS